VQRGIGIEVMKLESLQKETHKEFYFPGSSTGILLIHGFTGSPSEMRHLGYFLRDKGFTVKAVLLKGHGEAPGDMSKSNHRDWVESAELGYRELAECCREIFVVGFSMGGAIALQLAKQYDIKGIISLSTPIRLMNRQYLVAAPLKYLKNIWRKEKRVPIKAMVNLLQLLNKIKTDLHKMDKPILIMQSYGDQAVHPSSANFIYKRVSSPDKSIIFLHKSGHVITCDVEKEQVFDEVYHFIYKRCDQRIVEPFDLYSKTMEVL
jgi:carboxylesterase